MTEYVDIVMAQEPGPTGDFIEVENMEGRSVKLGEWHARPDGTWALRIGRDAINALTDRQSAERHPHLEEESSLMAATLASRNARFALDLADEHDLPEPHVTLQWHQMTAEQAAAIVRAYPHLAWRAGHGAVARWVETTSYSDGLDLTVFLERGSVVGPKQVLRLAGVNA